MLGKPVCTNIDEVLEKFQTAFDLPPLPFFGKNVAIFFYEIFWNGNETPKLASLMLKILQRTFLDRKRPPLPLELFQKFIDNGTDRRPLCVRARMCACMRASFSRPMSFFSYRG